MRESLSNVFSGTDNIDLLHKAAQTFFKRQETLLTASEIECEIISTGLLYHCLHLNDLPTWPLSQKDIVIEQMLRGLRLRSPKLVCCHMGRRAIGHIIQSCASVYCGDVKQVELVRTNPGGGPTFQYFEPQNVWTQFS